MMARRRRKQTDAGDVYIPHGLPTAGSDLISTCDEGDVAGLWYLW